MPTIEPIDRYAGVLMNGSPDKAAGEVVWWHSQPRLTRSL